MSGQGRAWPASSCPWDWGPRAHARLPGSVGAKSSAKVELGWRWKEQRQLSPPRAEATRGGRRHLQEPWPL